MRMGVAWDWLRSCLLVEECLLVCLAGTQVCWSNKNRSTALKLCFSLIFAPFSSDWIELSAQATHALMRRKGHLSDTE